MILPQTVELVRLGLLDLQAEEGCIVIQLPAGLVVAVASCPDAARPAQFPAATPVMASR